MQRRKKSKRPTFPTKAPSYAFRPDKAVAAAATAGVESVDVDFQRKQDKAVVRGGAAGAFAAAAEAAAAAAGAVRSCGAG